MSSITNVNNNAYVVNVGRTTPVSPGQQPANRSIPVVLATDQTPVPVEEQNKIQSEVALSLLGIPRSEVALGIFADVNTYDVNPSEWSLSPQTYITGHGIRHLPNEAGALVEAGRSQIAVLTSKRFFRYQPGRVSAATFGVKTTISQTPNSQNPTIRKSGIFDNFDGYYWEVRQDGQGDNFTVVRRMQSHLLAPNSPFGEAGDLLRGNDTGGATIDVTQTEDYRSTGRAAKSLDYLSNDLFVRDRQLLIDNRFTIANDVLTAVANTYGTDTNGDNYYEALANTYNTYVGSSVTDAAEIEEKCRRDIDYWIDMMLFDLEWGGNAHTMINITNFITGYNFLGGANTNANGVTFESLLYDDLKAEFSNYFSGDVLTKLESLSDLVIAAFSNTTVDTTQNGVSTTTVIYNLSAASYGQRSKIDTIYSTKKRYWAYYVSKFNQGTTPYAGDNGEKVYYDSDGVANTDFSAIAYTDSLGRDFTIEEVYYKCQRDIADYVVEGFKNDIVGGGDAETKYNMSMYLKGSKTPTETGLSVASQIVSEKATHTHLKQIILHDLETKFGYTTGTSTYLKQTSLSDRVIDNFDLEDTAAPEVGNRGFAGNLVVYRDNLVNIHAAVFDPNLLKPRKNIVAELDGTNNTIRIAEGNVTFGQHVKYTGATNGDLVANTVYKVDSVLGPKGNEFTLVTEAGGAVTFSDGTGTVQTVVPFIFPKKYYDYGEPIGDVSGLQTGMMFPYMYAGDGDLQGALEVTVGDINTTLTDPADIREQIDAVNFVPEYINWVKNNVDPEYYSVYEYRVPRSRFTHDKLDGEAGSPIVYSDIGTKESGEKAYPGEIYTVETQPASYDSVYEFDFTKVTMLKIEFSWYGAVGALFLAYVPVGNGEARWVRVHHMRASNQMKVPSLGNATLPITYNTYGGGTVEELGDDAVEFDKGYGSNSHHIVKYGASYYIDGGDRGTVRLFSHNNEDERLAYGKRWTVNTTGWNASDLSIPLDIVEGAGNTDPTFFMNATIDTGNRTDQGIYVEWANNTHIYLSSEPLANMGAIQIDLIPDRANYVCGLETKRNILSTIERAEVRNRVQVYPTKLSTANQGTNNVRLRMKKTPIFQTDVVPTGTLQLNTPYEITSEVSAMDVSNANYIQNGESVYGWFKARIDDPVSGLLVVVFGRLYRDSTDFKFELLETFGGTVYLITGSDFLIDGRYEANGTAVTETGRGTPIEKSGLSSIQIRDHRQVPIPKTGDNVANFFLQQGGTEQLDLSPYFDYNKEYLSFPLTNQTETLYLTVDSNDNSNTSHSVSLGITWEEQ